MNLPDTSGLSTRPIVQVCWHVPDVEAAVHQWAKVMGAGPFFFLPHAPLEGVTYRGEPTTYDHSAALGQWGDVQIELQHQHCANPSATHEMFGPDDSGILHLCWLVDDVDDEIARMDALGFPTVFTCTPGTEMYTAWFDTRAALGTYIECYQNNALVTGSYAAIKQASIGWDGSEPLRPFDQIMDFYSI